MVRRTAGGVGHILTEEEHHVERCPLHCGRGFHCGCGVSVDMDAAVIVVDVVLVTEAVDATVGVGVYVTVHVINTVAVVVVLAVAVANGRGRGRGRGHGQGCHSVRGRSVCQILVRHNAALHKASFLATVAPTASSPASVALL